MPNCGCGRPWRRSTCWRRATGSPSRLAMNRRQPIDTFGVSNIACRWSPTSRPTACPTSPRPSRASPSSSAMTGATRLPGTCSAISTSFRAIMRNCLRAIRPAPCSCRRSTTARARRSRVCWTTSRCSASSSRSWWRGRLRHWRRGEYRAFRSEAARSALADFVPVLIDSLAHAEEPDGAVVAFDRFLQSLQRGGRLISLLARTAIWWRWWRWCSAQHLVSATCWRGSRS